MEKTRLGQPFRDDRDRNRDRLSLVDLLEEIPWPDAWCTEAFMDRLSRDRQEVSNR